MAGRSLDLARPRGCEMTMRGSLWREDQTEGIGAKLTSQRDMLWLSEAADFDKRPARVREEGGRCPAWRRCQLTSLRRRIGRFHQRLADENGVRSPRAGAGGAERIEDTAFGDEYAVRWDEGAQMTHDIGIHGEGAQVATVDANRHRA